MFEPVQVKDGEMETFVLSDSTYRCAMKTVKIKTAQGQTRFLHRKTKYKKKRLIK